MNKVVIYQDLDGCIADFQSAACARFNIIPPSNHLYSTDTWLYEKLGNNKALFWSRIRGFNFWADEIKPYPWAKKVLSIYKRLQVEWWFLTKPSSDPHCYSGKAEFVKNHFHAMNKLILINGDKDKICKSKYDILIDDKRSNCDKWIAAGGTVYFWQEISNDYNGEEVQKRLLEIEDLIKNLQKE